MLKKIKTKLRRNNKAFVCMTALASLACCGLQAFDAYGMNMKEARVFRTLANGAANFNGYGLGTNYSLNISGVNSGADSLYYRSQSSDVYAVQEQNQNSYRSLASESLNLPKRPDPKEEDSNASTNGAYSDIRRTAIFQSYYYTFNGTTSIDNGLVDVETYRSNAYRHSRIGGIGFVGWSDPQGSSITLHAGYSRGRLSQSFDSSHEFGELGYFAEEEDIKAKIRLVDFQFGVTFDQQFDNGVIASLRLDGGAQDYGWSRTQEEYLEYEDNTRERTLSEIYQAALTGNTFRACFSLSKSYDLHNGWVLKPLASVSSSNSWIFAGTESGTNVGQFVHDQNMHDVWKPWRLSDTLSYSRNLAGVGTSLNYTDGGFGFNTRAYYYTQLGGRSAPIVSLANIDENATSVSVEGSGFGRDCLQLGVGTTLALDQAQRSLISGSYDVNLYRRGTGQVVNAGFLTTF